ISAVMHVVIILLFLALGLLDVRSKAGDITVTVNQELTSVDDQENSADLTDTEMGNDPAVPLNYNVERLADVSVPGVALPRESIGFPGAPDGPAMSVSPPPGANRGTGAGQDGSGTPSAFTDQGAVGGFYGKIAPPGSYAGRSAATKEHLLKEGGGTERSEA